MEKMVDTAETARDRTEGKTESSNPVVPPAVGNPDFAHKRQRAATLIATDGHPLQTFDKENKALAERAQAVKTALAEGNDVGKRLAEMSGVSVHYAKKGDLLYPPLKVRYNVTGPSDVMWTEDDEIRDELASLIGMAEHDTAWTERVSAVVKRIEEMIRKEENVLFPVCAIHFTEEEWREIYRDAKDYADCLGVVKPRWEEGEALFAERSPKTEGEISFPGGHLTAEQLTALLNTVPMEMTFIDDDNINRFFNEGPKAFKRPLAALDREVFSCHPPKVESVVRSILDDFRSGRRSRVDVWTDKDGVPMLVSYLAVRGKDGKYVGTVELVQDMTYAETHYKNQ